MKIIVVNQDHSRTRTYSGSGKRVGVLFCCAFLLSMAVGGGAMYAWLTNNQEHMLTSEGVKNWKQVLDTQQQDLGLVRQQAQNQLDALMLRLSELQGRMTRLDALGERLTSKAKLDDGEFDFGEAPALGGPQEFAEAEAAYSKVSLIEAIDQLADQIDNREEQLDLLDNLISSRTLHDDAFLAGLPVRKGWLSSRYGRRTDPFTGKGAWHNGVDFAGKRGSDIISVAAGVVVWSGNRSGFGLLVEVNHGNGYLTRYAHNDESLVKVGDIVTRGQAIAKMGSSGRSTGPHVHFEVLKNGKPQDPSRYIYRASK
ncbi:peptidoglycan DD-metalloendopeptidase family protein [Thalassotalea sp. G20_0]|uniref:M23 family metallopeptidase n=1 Tax=Thalassotalea sp. G20_0 TaxID=2821093 RepID=UPI001ADCF085|nr:peptidoglycan DD-metalloendopeptidase family protein [Thalassotalea sp. G20_0]MBO9494838.1 peptidoglycan DD-metalloendopeptidase family protein [Thalassotalea sp. G20_0]